MSTTISAEPQACKAQFEAALPQITRIARKHFHDQADIDDTLAAAEDTYVKLSEQGESPKLSGKHQAELVSVAARMVQLTHWHADFLRKSGIDERTATHARVRFRDVDEEKRDDAVAKAKGLAWKAYLSLREEGRDPNDHDTMIADLAVKQVADGRDVSGQQRAKGCAFSPCAAKEGLSGQGDLAVRRRTEGS